MCLTLYSYLEIEIYTLTCNFQSTSYVFLSHTDHVQSLFLGSVLRDDESCQFGVLMMEPR